MTQISLLQSLRLQEKPQLPSILKDLSILEVNELNQLEELSEIKKEFPFTANKKIVEFIEGKKKLATPKKVGVLFSGGQAPGGHNVILGLFDALKNLNSESELIGFLLGPEGLLKNQFIVLDKNLLDSYINQGGFDLLGSSRTKIDKEEQFQTIAKNVKALNLNALVFIGGDDTNTNAAFLAEYFLKEKIETDVIGVPKTIDGDLKSQNIEIPFGFDTACKTYSESLGNLARDALSSKKYYFFVKLMGRSASHITLECALEVQPNLALISEEIESEGKTLKDVVSIISDLIIKRAALGKNYGLILIPEGILEFIQEIKILISELNILLKNHTSEEINIETILNFLSEPVKNTFLLLPDLIKRQLLEERDPHGNVQLSKIETESHFIYLVKEELKKRKSKNEYLGKFNPQPIFLGYEGRSAFPSYFDTHYCYALGNAAALLIDANLTGYMACVKNLAKNTQNWKIMGVPFLSLMDYEVRNGNRKAVIKKALVDLKSPLFLNFKELRKNWLYSDDYQYPGPIQFYGPTELVEKVTKTLSFGMF